MDDNNKRLTNHGKAETAGKDIVETIARSESASLGGKVGTKLFDSAINTRHGQKSLTKVANNKILNKGPAVRTFLANNQQNISSAKTGAKGSSLGNSILDDSEQIQDTTNNVAGIGATNSEIKGSGTVTGLFKKNSLTGKLILFGVLGSFIFLIIFLIILITPLMVLGIIDIEDIGSSIVGSGGTSGGGGYISVPSSVSHWIPIGSSSTTTVGGVTFASGTPYTTTITSYFSAKEDFRTKSHGGVDFGNAGNGPGVVNVIASKDGTVVYPTSSSQTSFEDNGYYGNKDGGGFGNYVKIQHSDGTVTIYAHLSKNSITVFSGDTVKQGQVIGKMGHSGSSTGTHLHFEVRVNGNRVNPLNYISISNTRP